ncbi:MAG: lytic transglycosylase domain-containing protein [bacterium]|nr:lytic transglycosylase domain-containing protein [bacterium]
MSRQIRISKNTPRWIWAANAAFALLLGALVIVDTPPAAVAHDSGLLRLGSAPIVTVVESRDGAIRETILEMVRSHRRTTSDDWRRTLADAIYEEAVSAEMDPLMVASIVAKESSFKSRIVSSAGAIGLMQLRPWVARDVAQRTDVEWHGRTTLHSPSLNVRLGIQYYKELVDRFGDDRVALTAYNYGPTRVNRQLRKGTYSGSRYADGILGLYEEMQRRRTERSQV